MLRGAESDVLKRLKIILRDASFCSHAMSLEVSEPSCNMAAHRSQQSFLTDEFVTIAKVPFVRVSRKYAAYVDAPQRCAANVCNGES